MWAFLREPNLRKFLVLLLSPLTGVAVVKSPISLWASRAPRLRLKLMSRTERSQLESVDRGSETPLSISCSLKK